MCGMKKSIKGKRNDYNRIKTYLSCLHEIRRCKTQLESAYEILLKEERRFLHKIEREEEKIVFRKQR